MSKLNEIKARWAARSAAEREWQAQRLAHYLGIDYAEAMGIEVRHG